MHVRIRALFSRALHTTNTVIHNIMEMYVPQDCYTMSKQVTLLLIHTSTDSNARVIAPSLNTSVLSMTAVSLWYVVFGSGKCHTAERGEWLEEGTEDFSYTSARFGGSCEDPSEEHGRGRLHEANLFPQCDDGNSEWAGPARAQPQRPVENYWDAANRDQQTESKDRWHAGPGKTSLRNETASHGNTAYVSIIALYPYRLNIQSVHMFRCNTRTIHKQYHHCTGTCTYVCMYVEFMTIAVHLVFSFMYVTYMVSIDNRSLQPLTLYCLLFSK